MSLTPAQMIADFKAQIQSLDKAVERNDIKGKVLCWPEHQLCVRFTDRIGGSNYITGVLNATEFYAGARVPNVLNGHKEPAVLMQKSEVIKLTRDSLVKIIADLEARVKELV